MIARGLKGKRTRCRDNHAPLYQRVIDTGVLKPERPDELVRDFEVSKPADLTRQASSTKHCLIALAKDNTSAIGAGISRV